jgi:hypothetical protein
MFRLAILCEVPKIINQLLNAYKYKQNQNNNNNRVNLATNHI